MVSVRSCFVAVLVAAVSVLVLPVSAVSAAPSVSFVSSSGSFVDLWADHPGGSLFVGRDSSAPFVFSLDSTELDDGFVVLRARAFDGSWSVRPRTIVADNQAPQVSFAAPAPLTHHAGWVQVDADVTDANARFVDLYVAGQFYARDWSSPFSFNVNTNGLDDGTVELRLRAFDRAGQLSVVSRNITVSTEQGTVVIATPGPGCHVRGTVGVTAEAAGGAPVAQTEFLVNGSVVQSFPYLPRVISWHTASTPEGTANLQVRVTDKAGNVTTSPIRVVTLRRRETSRARGLVRSAAVCVAVTKGAVSAVVRRTAACPRMCAVTAERTR